MRNKITLAFVSLSGLAVVLLDRLVLQDIEFKNRWWFFFIWIGLLILSLVVCFFPELKVFFKGLVKRDIKFKIDIWFLLIIVAALATRFFLINSYPFPTIGDELRDGGLDAIGIAKGTIENIFYYGRYESHGLIIPTFASFFYPIFGESSLLFKVPAAIIGTLDIVLLYQLVKRLINKKVAIVAAFVLIGMPLHLYYSRTELVVIFSSFMTTLSLWFFYIWMKNNFKLRHLAALGLMLGLTINFHGSVRIVAYILIMFALLIEIFYLTRKIFLKHPGKLIYFVEIVSFIILIFVGFGPRLVYSTTKILFQTSTIPLISTVQDSKNSRNLYNDLIDKAREALDNYPKAFLVYFYEPTQFHYSDHEPILPQVVGIFFIAGIIFAVMQRKKEYLPFILLLFILPFTNSAMTNCVNCDHRLAPVLSLVSIFTALGVVGICKLIGKLIKYPLLGKSFVIGGLILFVIAVPVSRTVAFFKEESANDSMFRIQRDHLYQDFMATYIKNDLKENNYQGNICIRGNNRNYDYFKLMHVQEMFTFYLPEVNVNVKEDLNINAKSIYISDTCEEKIDSVDWRLDQPCKVYQKYLCPIDQSTFSLYFAKDLY